MLQLYFFPMACSLASRMALMEAGIEARYHLVHIWSMTAAISAASRRKAPCRSWRTANG